MASWNDSIFLDFSPLLITAPGPIKPLIKSDVFIICLYSPLNKNSESILLVFKFPWTNWFISIEYFCFLHHVLIRN
jgi:hypothetical protein